MLVDLLCFGCGVHLEKLFAALVVVSRAVEERGRAAASGASAVACLSHPASEQRTPQWPPAASASRLGVWPTRQAVTRGQPQLANANGGVTETSANQMASPTYLHLSGVDLAHCVCGSSLRPLLLRL